MVSDLQISDMPSGRRGHRGHRGRRVAASTTETSPPTINPRRLPLIMPCCMGFQAAPGRRWYSWHRAGGIDPGDDEERAFASTRRA